MCVLSFFFLEPACPEYVETCPLAHAQELKFHGVAMDGPAHMLEKCGGGHAANVKRDMVRKVGQVVTGSHWANMSTFL